MEAHTYSVDLHWLENRKGVLASALLDDKLEVATPPEFKGGMPRIWTPEHLFLASASSCFMTTFLAIAEKFKLNFINFECTASGTLEKSEGQLMVTTVILKPAVSVSKSGDIDLALKVLDLTHHGCPISRSMKSEIVLMPRVALWHESEPIENIL